MGSVAEGSERACTASSMRATRHSMNLVFCGCEQVEARQETGDGMGRDGTGWGQGGIRRDE
jgi:hypothetical protein